MFDQKNLVIGIALLAAGVAIGGALLGNGSQAETDFTTQAADMRMAQSQVEPQPSQAEKDFMDFTMPDLSKPKEGQDVTRHGCHLIACRSARSFLAMGHRLPGAVSSSRSTLSRRMVGLRGRTFLCVKRTHRPSRADGATASAEWFSPRPGRDVSARRKADAERLGIRPWLQVRAGMIGRISAWHA